MLSKTHRKDLIIGIWAIPALYIIYIVFIFYLSNYEVSQYQNQEYTHYKYSPASFVIFIWNGGGLLWNWLSDNDKPLLVSFTIGIFVVTALLAKYTLKLWGSTNELVKDAKDTAKRQLRAYLGVSRCGVEILSQTHIQVFVEVTNTGATPAHNAIQAIKASIIDAGAVATFPPQKTDRGPNVIVPGGHITLRFDIPKLPAGTLKQIVDGALHIFAWGSVHYIDIFTEPQELHFRYKDVGTIYDTTGKDHPTDEDFVVGWEFQPEEEGNTST